jgi:hypothetical protein
MDEAKVELVESEGLTVDFLSISATMTIRTKGNQVFIVVRSTLVPRDDVVNFNIDVATGGDGATMSSLDKDTSADFSWYGRAPIPA